MPSTDIKDYWRRAWGIGDRQPRRRYLAGALGAAPVLSYPVMLGIAKVLGISTAGVGATALSSAVSNKIKENPEILNTPQAKAIMLSFGLVPPKAEDLTHKSVTETGLGLDIGDKGEKEKERERIIEEEKKKYQDIKWGEREKINLPTHTGHPAPVQEKWEPPISPPVEVEQLPPFPDQSEEFNKPQIFYNEEALKKMTIPKEKNKVIKILDQQSKEIPKLESKKDIEKFLKSIEKKSKDVLNNQYYKEPIYNEAYMKVLTDYVADYHGGNVSKASTELGFDRRTIQARLTLKGFSGKGQTAEALLDIPQGTLTYTEVMENMKNNPTDILSEINVKIKKGDLKKSDYIESIDLANLIGMDGSTKERRNLLLKKIRQLDIRQKPGTQGGKAKAYHLGDVLNELIFYASKERSALHGEAENYQHTRIQRDINPGLDALLGNLKRHVASRAKKSDIVLPQIRLGEDKGHAEAFYVIEKYPKLFKDSNIKSLQTLVRQDPEVNQKFLVKRGYHSTNDAIYKKLSDNKLSIEKANFLLKANHERIKKIIQNEARKNDYFINQEKRIPLLQVNKDKIINADMSTVDNFYIYGKINEVNPDAETVADLSKKETELFMNNLKDQYVDSAAKFLTEMREHKTDEKVFSTEEVEDYIDILHLPIMDTGTKYKFATGGLTGVDQYIINRHR